MKRLAVAVILALAVLVGTAAVVAFDQPAHAGGGNYNNC